jgi:tetratricopeptide (TPR) repeat protein
VTHFLLLAWSVVAAPGGVLVVPPEPTTPTPETSWVGEAVADLLPGALARAGVPAIERADRLRVQGALEIPPVPLTHATSMRVAEAAGASRLVVGSYAVDGGKLTLTLRLLDAAKGQLGPMMVAGGPTEMLLDLVYALAWDAANLVSATPPLTRMELLQGRPQIPFEALQAYGRGLLSRDVAIKNRLFRRAIALAPSYHEARLALGRLQIESGELTAGHDTLARIPAASPLARQARFLQGVALTEIGKYREAGEVFARLAAEVKSAAVLNNQALALLRGGVRDPRPSALLREAAALEPESVDVAFNLGFVLLSEGDPEGAAFVLRPLVRRDPLEPNLRLLLTWALRQAGRGPEADEEWKGVLAMAPNLESSVQPDVTRRFERLQQSERLLMLERTPRTEAEVAAGLTVRAERLLLAGEAEAALRELARAAYLDPTPPQVHILLGRAYRQTGARDRAVSEYQVALWSHDDGATRAELAQLLRDMGRADEARAEAAKALKLDPGNEAARRVLQP